MRKHTLKLLGGPRDTLRVPAEVLLEVVGALLDGARLATRFLVDGESVRKGPRPAWLDQACALEVTGLRAGSAIVEIEAPTLAKALGTGAARLHPLPLFVESAARVDVEQQSAVDCFAEVLAAVMSDERDQVFADRALLDACVRFARAGSWGFDGVELGGLGHRGPIVLRAGDIERIELLRDETPAPRAVRIAGTLDTISATKTDVLLTLPGGEQVPARLEAHDPEWLKVLFGQRVVISGIAHFRPSGRLLVVAAEHLAPARAEDALFEEAPSGKPARAVAAVLPQEEGCGVSAFFGTWPGDETEAELLEQLRAME
jgi:hypothetical protein